MRFLRKIIWRQKGKIIEIHRFLEFTDTAENHARFAAAPFAAPRSAAEAVCTVRDVNNKKWPSSLERGMLLVRRARRWALRKLICKIERHDDSKTISWHASFPVRFARLLAALPPKLASSRLRQRLFGAATSQTSRRKPCYRQSDCFRIHHGCIILRTMFYNAVRLHIAKSFWPAGGHLSGTVLSGQITKHEKTETL